MHARLYFIHVSATHFVDGIWKYKIYRYTTFNGRDSVLKSPASRLFTQPIIQTQIKGNIKAPRHWTFCGEFTGDRWIPRTNGQ